MDIEQCKIQFILKGSDNRIIGIKVLDAEFEHLETSKLLEESNEFDTPEDLRYCIFHICSIQKLHKLVNEEINELQSRFLIKKILDSKQKIMVNVEFFNSISAELCILDSYPNVSIFNFTYLF
jgi:hypothetical protein